MSLSIESKSLEELEDLLTLVRSRQERAKNSNTTKLKGKVYLQLEKSIHCRTCGSTKVCLLQLGRSEETTITDKAGHTTVVQWKLSSEILRLDSYTYTCEHCKERIKLWPRALLEKRLLKLAHYNQEAIFGQTRVPPFLFHSAPYDTGQLCLPLVH